METVTEVRAYSIEWTFDNRDYWVGVGTAFTEWDTVATGIGFSDSLEAFDDALDQLAELGYDTTDITWYQVNNPAYHVDECDDCDESSDCPMQFYVSIYVR